MAENEVEKGVGVLWVETIQRDLLCCNRMQGVLAG